MSYDSTREADQLKMMGHAIDEFVLRYPTTRKTSSGARRTVFVFPGGLASTLMRATEPFDDSNPGPQTFSYEPVWATVLSLLGGSLDLAMKKIAPDTYVDKDNRIIVADGAIDIDGILALPDDLPGLGGVSPYTGFTEWCELMGFDWFVVGWDWRRKMQHSGDFFVQQFLPFFKSAVQGLVGADPLADFSLVGHSAGGMVVNWILRTDHPNLDHMRRAVTVGAPFYGYAGQGHRWFEGDALVNGPGNAFRPEVIKMISTLPACYAWNFLDEAIYNVNAVDFGADPHFPLAAYPSMDKTIPGLVADPYVPQTKVVGGNVFTRYPTTTGFDADELEDARTLITTLASPLTAAQAAKFYNLRGVQTNPGLGGLVDVLTDVLEHIPGFPHLPGAMPSAAIKANTTGSSQWAWLPSSALTPITDGPPVPGDGTQPAWSARHLGLAKALPGHVIDVPGPDIEHATLMSSPTMLAKLVDVLDF